MAAQKRKSSEENGRLMKRKGAAPTKKPKSTSNSTRPEQTSDQAERRLPTASILLEEERAFPRGGGHNLTPLERKQIQIKADRDVLFEESGQKRAPVQQEDSEYDEEVQLETDKPTVTARPRKKQRVSVQKEHGETNDPPIRVEALKTKNIQPGSLILGQISKVTDHHIVLDLPNNLTGSVPITAISAQLNKKLEAALQDDTEEQDTRSIHEDNTDLRNYFSIGQYLRSSVTSTVQTSTEGTGKVMRKRIELSIDPSHVNKGIPGRAIPVNAMVQASVISIEDHGAVMDIGLEDGDVKGFMSSKETPYGMADSDMKTGMVFLCLVTGLSSNGKVAKLSANHNKAGDIRKSHVLNEAPTIDPLLPGAAVEVLITHTTLTTVAGSILGMFNATSDSVHCGAGPQALDPESRFKIGSKQKARITYKLAGTETPSVAVSFLDHVLHLDATRTADGDKSTEPLDRLPMSHIVESTKVENASASLGLYLDVGVKSLPAFVHLSRICDGRIDTIDKATGPYRIGSHHRARIMGFNRMDGLYLASMEKSVLDQPFLRVEDVPVGEIVKGTVNEFKLGAKGLTGLIVDLADGLSGLVPEIHMADIHLEHPERKFKKGVPVSARVLATIPERNQLRLSLKKSLISSELPIWKSYEDISIGERSLGTVINSTEKGAFLQFYGNLRAFLPAPHMNDAFVKDPKTFFRIGQTVAVRAIHMDVKAGRMKVSCRSKSRAKEPKETEPDGTAQKDTSNGEVQPSNEMNPVPDAHIINAKNNHSATTTKSFSKLIEDTSEALDAGPFDWNPTARQRSPSVLSNAPSESELLEQKKKRSSDAFEDHTADLATHGPRSSSDFERLLLARRDDPTLWVQYMAFHVDAGSLTDARKIAERATRSISITLDQEKLEVWTAWLNLELAFGDDGLGALAEVEDDEGIEQGPIARLPLGGRVKQVFAKACAVQDRVALTERLVRSLTRFGKLDAAAGLYESMSHDKAFTASPALWIAYGTFLMRDAEPNRPSDARALVPRATQTLPEREHVALLMRFAQLEFKCSRFLSGKKGRGPVKGGGIPERGRTLFADLVSRVPRRGDVWDVWMAMEMALLRVMEENRKDEDEGALKAQEERVRELFERQTGDGSVKMKKKRARGIFERWKEFEEGLGAADKMKRVDKVKAREKKYEDKRTAKGEE